MHENLEIIGTGAFCKATIEELRIPNSVKKICSYAFQTTKNLKHVEIPLCLMDTTEWFCDSNINSVSLPEGMREIGSFMFLKTPELKHITLPSTITSIGKRAFMESAIQEIIIPEGVKEIGEAAFAECHNLMKVKLPSTITSIGKKAFVKSAIQEIIIPEGVKEIGEEAFCECNNLMQVKLPSTITSIGKKAFAKSAIQEIIIPEGVKEIGEEAFRECNNLMKVKLPSTITSIGKKSFALSAIKEIIIPEGVKEIEDKAFALCYNLSSITLPKSLFEIKSYAFASCDVLKDIYLHGVPKVYGLGIFSQRIVNIHLLDNEPSAQYERFFKLFNYRNSTFYVPNENYAFWKKLFKDIEFISESITDIRGEAKTVEEIKKISNEKQEITNKTERSSVDKVQTNKGSQSNIIIDKLWVETDGKKEFTMSWLWTANNMDGHSLKCCVNIKAKSGKDLDFKSITVNKEFQIKGQSFQSKTGISLSYNEFNIAHNEEKKIEFNIEIYDSITQKCVYASENEDFNIWYYFNVFPDSFRVK